MELTTHTQLPHFISFYRSDLKAKLRECFNSSPEEICKIYSWLGVIKPFSKQLTSITAVDDYLQELLVRL